MRFKNIILKSIEIITLKYIHIKHFYPYLFVHKPLCTKFMADTIKIKNIYICRSCFFLYLGIFLAFILYKYINFNYFVLLIFFLLIILLSNPMYYKFYSRIFRDFSRFFLGFLTIILLLKTYYYNVYVSVGIVLCLLVIKHLYNIQRKKVDLCYNCEELVSTKICSGYTLQTNALLQEEEEMSNYIMYNRWRFKND